MKSVMRSLTILSFALLFAPVSGCSGETEDHAVKIAEEWLQLVD